MIQIITTFETNMAVSHKFEYSLRDKHKNAMVALLMTEKSCQPECSSVEK